MTQPHIELSAIAHRPTLAAWLQTYREINQGYLSDLTAQGITFAEPHADARACQKTAERLRAKGAQFRNGGASVSIGQLSSACEACATDEGSQTFHLSLACNRNCFFCFNVNQENFHEEQLLKNDWREELNAFVSSRNTVTHIGLTGGEPLLHAKQAIAFFRHAHKLVPHAHLRLYTAGDFLTEDLLVQLRDAGLTEIRLSVKPDEPDATAQALERIKLCMEFIPQVMVEMPVFPDSLPEMKELLRGMDALGAFGINLLELGYPLGNWEPFAKRNLKVANPPFEVLYNYTYAAGLPISGSAHACLQLVEFALDEGLSLGVHYCSLKNKNCMQLSQQNSVAQLDRLFWHFDENDFFWKTIKLYDRDYAVAAQRLSARGISWCTDPNEASMLVHPDALNELVGLPVVPMLSYNVLEGSGDDVTLRELKLEPCWPVIAA